MEFGLPFLGLGLDYADAYPFLGSFELPPNAPPSLRQDVSRKERLFLRESIVMWISMNFHVMKWTRERPGAMICPPVDTSVGRESGGWGGALCLPC